MSYPPDPEVALIARISAVPTILRVISRSTGLRLTLVARVTDTMWKACAVDDQMQFGLEPGGELDLHTTLCHEVAKRQAAVVIDHASQDAVYCDHQTPKMYGFESYISVPIVAPDGSYFGNLCGLDTQPLPLRESGALDMLTLYAELIGLQIQAEQKQQRVEEELSAALEVSGLREQFIAALGHDMRAPLSAVVTGADLMLARGVDDKQGTTLTRMRRSAMRMSRLIDDLLDFARGRLGGGIPLNRKLIADLRGLVEQATGEFTGSFPHHTIMLEVESFAYQGDPDRLHQVMTNLLSNALHHGAPGEVRVTLSRQRDAVRFAVHNAGTPIDAAMLPHLFEPYVRQGAGQGGLGLGLYIVSEVVKAHGGRVAVQSGADGTLFECFLPRTDALPT